MPRNTKSNATQGTKQIWVADELHQALLNKAEAEDRTLKKTVERILWQGLNKETTTKKAS